MDGPQDRLALPLQGYRSKQHPPQFTQ
jgi:hypothetical protein